MTPFNCLSDVPGKSTTARIVIDPKHVAVAN